MSDLWARVLLIVPALNEEQNVGLTVREILSADAAYDVVVVDDGSVDGTAAVARDAGARVLALPFNLGVGGAMRTGFTSALRHGYELGRAWGRERVCQYVSISVVAVSSKKKKNKN